MTIPKMHAKYKQSNLDAAKHILKNPDRFVDGGLMKRWAEEYLRKHAEEAAKKVRQAK
jgi:hypothetical protein